MTGDATGPDADPVQRCIERVLAAASRLERVLQSTAFPALTPPQSDREARDRVACALDWWCCLEATHGSPAGRGTASRLIRDVPIEDRSLHWHFDPWFQGTGARSAFDPRAEDVLGALPPRLRELPSPFLSPFTITHSVELLPDASGLPSIRVSVENWAAVRRILEVGRDLVLRHCDALLNWVRTQAIQAITPRVPAIHVERAGARGNTRLRVSIDGQTRTVEVTRTELAALRELKVRGVAAIDRGKKAGLVKKIPELDPHLAPTSELRLTSDSASAEYRLAELARHRLNLDGA